MKKWILLLLVLFSGIALAGCNKSEGKTTITFWHIWPVGDPSFSKMNAIIRDFNESQDEYVVKGTGYSFWDHIEKIRMSISTNTMPNLSIFSIDDVQQRAAGGKLLNVSELMKNDPEHGIKLDNYFENQINFVSYKEDLYALPFSATTRLLYYNLDMFEAAGLTEADVPTTWSELETVAKQLDILDASGNIKQLGFDPSYGNVAYHSYLWQKGLDMFDEDLNVTLQGQEYIDVLNWIKDFNSDIPRAKLTAFGEQNATFGTSPFASERVAMIIEVDDLHYRIQDYGSNINYGVTYIPVPDDEGIRINWGSGFSLELYDTGKLTDAQKKGTWEFAKYIASVNVQKRLADATGWLMGNKEAMQDYVKNNALLSRIFEEVSYAKDKVYVPYAPNWNGDFVTFWNSFLNDEYDAQAALQAAIRHFNEKKTNWEKTQ
ncbi:MAG: extracellular solute-binding protein [Acholeplasmataceae bacterium]